MTNITQQTLPETKYFKIERRPWMDRDGREYYGISAKASTLDSTAMVFNLPMAHWNLAAMIDMLPVVNEQYENNRAMVEKYKPAPRGWDSVPGGVVSEQSQA